jgi:putative peptidoglycan lipid II flippase
MKEAAGIQNRSLEFVLFMTLPAAAGLWVMSEPIIRVLYERGAFSAETRPSWHPRSPSTASACRVS